MTRADERGPATGPAHNDRRHDHEQDLTLDQRYPALNWHDAFTARPVDVPWLVEPLFERGRVYVVYSPAKVGKSLLLQDVGARAAAGRSVLGRPAQAPIRVLYLDQENTVDDVVERMTDYGFGPDDLTNLVYLSFPPMPPLNSLAGGMALVDLVAYHQAELVIIDTVARVISGPENDADTMHALARLAITPLKAAGVTVVRLDHAGKDPQRGQRGSSAKATDVDVVWRLAVAEGDIVLTREDSRNNHHPDAVQLRREFDPLRHVVVTETLPADALRVLRVLDRLDVDPDMGRDRVRALLVAHNVRARNQTLNSVLRHRRSRAGGQAVSPVPPLQGGGRMGTGTAAPTEPDPAGTGLSSGNGVLSPPVRDRYS